MLLNRNLNYRPNLHLGFRKRQLQSKILLFIIFSSKEEKQDIEIIPKTLPKQSKD